MWRWYQTAINFSSGRLSLKTKNIELSFLFKLDFAQSICQDLKLNHETEFDFRFKFSLSCWIIPLYWSKDQQSNFSHLKSWELIEFQNSFICSMQFLTNNFFVWSLILAKKSLWRVHFFPKNVHEYFWSHSEI